VTRSIERDCKRWKDKTADGRFLIAISKAFWQALLRGAVPLPRARLDVDYYKRINDTLGRAAGDRVLKSVAQCIEDSFRTYDHVGRFGGDEFVVILPDTPAAEAASALSAQPPCTPRT
jgi:diguanylate cyclase (GGDEF)-like protein